MPRFGCARVNGQGPHSKRAGRGASEIALTELRGDPVNEVGGSLTRYLREVCRTQLFTLDEAYRCACAARASDFAARQAMDEHNLHLVVNIAKNCLGMACC